ncbi:MAG: hypothetical protein ACK56F_32550, partial [bacterium]
MRELTLLAVLALAVLAVLSTHLGLVAAVVDLLVDLALGVIASVVCGRLSRGGGLWRAVRGATRALVAAVRPRVAAAIASLIVVARVVII